MESTKIYENRFSHAERKKREKLWKILCQFYFQRQIAKKDVVVDMGAGFCEFINHIKCGKKIAVDVNPNLKKYTGKDVTAVIVKAEKIPGKYYGKADIVFMSNFLEHLPTKDRVVEVLRISHRLLKPNGKIIIMQPNIDLAKERYWDHIDHNVALNGESVIEALEISGFKVREFVKRFLPLTTKSRLPQTALLVKFYLSLPSFLRPLAGQSLFVAIKA